MPSEAPQDRPADAPPPFGGYLHPFTLLFAGWDAVRRLLVPALVLLVLRSELGLALLFLIALLPQLAFAVVRYFTFTYRLERGELVTCQGVFERVERHIPLDRIQDIRIEQRLLHRLLRMADVEVETAGGQGAEASLSVLSRDEAERLRRAVFAQADRLAAAGQQVPRAAKPTEREILCRLQVRDLVMAGMTSNWVAPVLVLAATAWAFLDRLLPPETYERVVEGVVERIVTEWTHWWGQELTHLLLLGAVLLLALLLLGLIASVAASVILFYGFTLSLSGEDLHRAYGLLTRRASSLPRRRIQVLKLEETPLRRLFGLAAVRADTAGAAEKTGQQKAAGRDVLLPIASRSQAEALLPVFFSDLDPEPPAWQRVSRLAIRRGTAKGALACAALAAAGYWLLGPAGLAPLALLPLIYGLNVLHYRSLGYALGENYFRTRRGWLSRSTHLVPLRNIQAVLIRQTPFDRRLKLATVVVDTAGQAYTGGGPSIANLPLAEARELARTLAHRAARRRFHW